MKDLTTFKNKIFLYAILIMIICEIVTLPFLGLNLKYTYGLVLGTAVSIVNFNLMAITNRLALVKRSGAWVTIGYFLRVLIYGGVFAIAIKTSNYAGLGAVIGFITVKLAIYFIHGFKPKVGQGYEPVEKIENGSKSKAILIKDPYMILYCRGHKVVTHKKHIKK